VTPPVDLAAYGGRMSAMPRWRAHADVLLATLVAGLLLVELLADGSAEATRVLPSAPLVGLGVYLRRRQPVVGLVLVVAAILVVEVSAPRFTDESLAVLLAFGIALYSVGRWATGGEAWTGAAAVLGTMVFFAIGDARQNDVELRDVAAGSVGFAIAFVGGPWAAGLAIRLRRDHESRLHEENRRLQEEQEERARRAVADERARIARELHDVVSHAISVTVLQARGARAVLQDTIQVRHALDAIERTNTQALGDMRRLLAVLRDVEDRPDGATDPAPQPSLANLGALLERVRDAGVRVELEVDGDTVAVPPGVDLSAYRIVQEALTNVLKHAGAARARVRLEYAPQSLDVVVVDDGPGAADRSANGDGHGLIGIRERVSVIGGQVFVGPGDDGGFEVRAHLPFAVEAP
jgi:signal transduction histidine kinase